MSNVIVLDFTCAYETVNIQLLYEKIKKFANEHFLVCIVYETNLQVTCAVLGEQGIEKGL